MGFNLGKLFKKEEEFEYDVDDLVKEIEGESTCELPPQ